MHTKSDEIIPAANLPTIAGFLLKPYFNRVKLGEGGLVVFNFFHSVYAHREPVIIALEVSISFLVMCALYGFNDFTDRHKDGLNEKKDKPFVTSILQHEKLFLGVNVLLTVITLCLALFFLGQDKAVVMLLLYGVNFLYSKKFKSVPVLDILAVGLWGGLYVMLSGSFQWTLIFIVGIMTSIAHTFQIMTDKVSDGENKIKTTAVVLPGSEIVFLSLLCVALGSFLFSAINIWWALSASLPVLVYALSRQVTLSWYVSRVYFFICWIGLLTLYYGSP